MFVETLSLVDRLGRVRLRRFRGNPRELTIVPNRAERDEVIAGRGIASSVRSGCIMETAQSRGDVT